MGRRRIQQNVLNQYVVYTSPGFSLAIILLLYTRVDTCKLTVAKISQSLSKRKEVNWIHFRNKVNVVMRTLSCWWLSWLIDVTSAADRSMAAVVYRVSATGERAPVITWPVSVLTAPITRPDSTASAVSHATMATLTPDVNVSSL